MLRLVINDRDVELYQNAPVNLTFQYNDIEQINNPLGSYSQAFRVPLTRINRVIFGELNVPTEVDGLDLRQRLNASFVVRHHTYHDGVCTGERRVLDERRFRRSRVGIF